MNHFIAGTLDVDDCPDDRYSDRGTLEDPIKMLETLNGKQLPSGN